MVTSRRASLAVLALLAHLDAVNAFASLRVPPVSSTPAIRKKKALYSTESSQFDDLLKETKLREAVRYLRENPETKLNKERWNNIFEAIGARTANAEETAENLRVAVPIESAARKEMTDMYQTLRDQGKLTLYGAVDSKIPPAAGTHTLPPALLEEILGMPMQALTPKPNNNLLVAGATVAVAEGILSLALGVPLNLLIFLTAFLVSLDRVFLNGATSESFLKLFSPGVQDKILRHEAGHFLAAYLLGCPVEGIVLSAWGALKDRRFGSRQVTAGTSFFDPELSRAINQGGSRLTRSTIDRYSIIVMAGIAAEAENYGRADGGAGDELALVGFLSPLNANGRGTIWDADGVKNQARWGAMQAVLMIREYRPAYDALVDALERGGSLGECIYAIEKAARENNLGPLKEPLGLLVEKPLGEVAWTNDLSEPEKPVAVVSTQPPKPEQTNVESMESLKEYRQAMEKRLEEIDQQLKSLDR